MLSLCSQTLHLILNYRIQITSYSPSKSISLTIYSTSYVMDGLPNLTRTTAPICLLSLHVVYIIINLLIFPFHFFSPSLAIIILLPILPLLLAKYLPSLIMFYLWTDQFIGIEPVPFNQENTIRFKDF